MKHYNILRCVLFITLAALINFSCSSDDDNSINYVPLFKESDMSIIHNNSEKSWHITGFINKYHKPNYHLEINLNCLEDDLYTFASNTESISINLGNNKCFDNPNNDYFGADIELFNAKLLYMNKTIMLEFSIGYVNNSQTSSSAALRWYKLAELSENRMVFYRNSNDILGQYNEAIIFESL